jgi:hypothetical protein
VCWRSPRRLTARAQNGASGTSTGQSAPAAQTSSSSPAPAEETRPATTTFNGDTGLWYVPTAEVLGKGKWSTSGYRRGTNWIQGYTNVADFAGTFAVGVGDRAEVFGSFLVDTRIDHDSRPIFGTDPAFGSFIDRYPKVNQYWTGDNVGDLYVGAKFNILSESRNDPAAVALRGMVKLPTGKFDAGVSTGKATCRSTPSSARKQRSSWKSPATAATSGAAARTDSTFRAARSGGAPG